ncbi:MAG TPA: dipeptidase [Bacteroidota bacterium]
MKLFTRYFALLLLVGPSWSRSQQTPDSILLAKAKNLAREILIVDTHIDVPDLLREKWEDISQRLPDGEFDYPRAKEGGLKAPFMSIYTGAEEEAKGTANKSAEEMIDTVESFAKEWPDKFAIATSVADVARIVKNGRIALCLGMENGAPIEGKLPNVRHFFNRGIRYITLAHFKDNHISDSSADTTHTWHGLSPFGRRVVEEMNRLGIMVDVSHISDDAFYEVMKISRAPAIASHSSCRYFTPGFERNMSDDMIRLLAKNGGVIQIAFGSSFLTQEYRNREAALRSAIQAYLREHHLTRQDSAGRAFASEYARKNPLGYADVKDVVAHIDHVVKLVGVDYVGLGSDFDGAGDEQPIGLKDVSQYPNLICELLKAGYSENDIRKICGENLMRVWSKVEATARTIQAEH